MKTFHDNESTQQSECDSSVTASEVGTEMGTLWGVQREQHLGLILCLSLQHLVVNLRG